MIKFRKHPSPWLIGLLIWSLFVLWFWWVNEEDERTINEDPGVAYADKTVAQNIPS